MTQVKQAKIVSYLRGGNTQNNNQVLIKLEDITSDKEASRYVGYQCIWESSTGTRLTGKVIRPHGKSGALLAAFKKSIPGQALGSPVALKPT